MKNIYRKTGRLGIVLMLVIGLFLPSYSRQIYPLQNNLLDYHGSNSLVQKVIVELKKPQNKILLSRLKKHGTIGWDSHKALLSSCFLEGPTLRFYSADSNYFDAHINAKTEAIQLLDKVQVQAEVSRVITQKQRANLRKAKQLGLKTNDDSNWPLCSHSNAKNLCEQVVDFAFTLDSMHLASRLLTANFCREFTAQLKSLGYKNFGRELIGPSRLKTSFDVFDDVMKTWGNTMHKFSPDFDELLSTIRVLWAGTRSSCCPQKAEDRLIAGEHGLLSYRAWLITEKFIEEEAAANAAFANNPVCHGMGMAGDLTFSGSIEHLMIQVDYLTTVLGSLRDYSIPADGGGNLRAGFADIVNTITGEMFEIKPIKMGEGVSVGKIEEYVSLAQKFCPPPSSGAWRLGSNYGVKYFPHPKETGKTIMVFNPEPGLILYNIVENNEVGDTVKKYKDTPQLPFALKNLNYQLTVNLIQTDCRMEMVLKQGMAHREEELLERIYSFVDSYNDNSEKKQRKYGVVHNANGYLDQNKENLLHLEIDIGSVGPDFFKKLFKLFNDLDAFESVTVD